jgi:hypothetical protein
MFNQPSAWGSCLLCERDQLQPALNTALADAAFARDRAQKASVETGAKCTCKHDTSNGAGHANECPVERRAVKTSREHACPKCKTLLAFEGDTCWACSKEERL